MLSIVALGALAWSPVAVSFGRSHPRAHVPTRMMSVDAEPLDPRFDDMWEIVGAGRSASKAELRQAYRRKARTLHPDVSADPDAPLQFRRLSTAFEMLMDDSKRLAFEALAVEINNKAGPSTHTSPWWKSNARWDAGARRSQSSAHSESSASSCEAGASGVHPAQGSYGASQSSGPRQPWQSRHEMRRRASARVQRGRPSAPSRAQDQWVEFRQRGQPSAVRVVWPHGDGSGQHAGDYWSPDAEVRDDRPAETRRREAAEAVLRDESDQQGRQRWRATTFGSYWN